MYYTQHLCFPFITTYSYRECAIANVFTTAACVLAFIMWTAFCGLLLLSSYNIVIIYGDNVLPSIDFQDPNVRYKSVRDKADKIGAFEVTNIGQSYQKSMQKFFLNAPACLQQGLTLPNMVMNDGSVRKTFAKSASNEYFTTFSIKTPNYQKGHAHWEREVASIRSV